MALHDTFWTVLWPATWRYRHLKVEQFARYERHLGRVLDLYLKFVTAWYTQEFAEVFLQKRFSMIAPRMSLEPK